MSRRAAHTMLVSSSMTVIPPEPDIEPAIATDSKSIWTSRWSGVKNGADAPPGIKAFKGLLDRIPPPRSMIKSRKVAFIGNS